MLEQMKLRGLDAGDGFLLRVATLTNVNWSGVRFDYAQVAAEPHLAHYWHVFPDRGDYGFVALEDGEIAGVVWVKYFSADEAGYGFVRSDVPELSVCVLPGYRGAGRGRGLVRAAITEARRRGIGEVSLSVEDGNPARRLYESLVFAPVPSARQPGTLALVLDERAEPV